MVLESLRRLQGESLGTRVIGTLTTSSAPDTMNRLLDVFPYGQQAQIRSMVAESLKGVICQQLLPNAKGDGVVLVAEIMLGTLAVSNLIREGKTFRLQSTMATSNKQGMCTFDQCILEKFTLGLMIRDAALAELTDQVIISQLNSVWARQQAQANRK